MEFIIEMSKSRVIRLFLHLVLALVLLPSNALAVNKQSAVFNFYGNTVWVHYDEALKNFSFSESGITRQYLDQKLAELDKTGLKATIDELYTKGKEFSLDGLGFLQLLKKFTQYVFPEKNFAFKKTVVWYGLRYKKYDAILLGNEAYFNLFIQTDYEADTGFRIVNEGKQYISATNEKLISRRIHIYTPALFNDSAKTTIDFDPFNTPKLGSATTSKSRSFEYKNQHFIFNGRYNKNLVDYLNELPGFKIGSYMYVFQPSKEAEQSIDDSMSVWLKGKSYKDKLDFMLNFVQNAFPYKADGDYRTREKRNFIEQTLADEFVDCEDKAAMFCYLAQKYLFVETVLLYSKEKVHVCSAIEMPENSPGYTFKRLGKPYLVCEPAFQGYKAGETNLTATEILHLQIFR